MMGCVDDLMACDREQYLSQSAKMEQYATTDHLLTRRGIHGPISTNPTSWFHWLGVQAALSEGERVLDDLVRPIVPDLPTTKMADRFGLQNGAAQLAPWVAEIARSDYRDRLRVTQPEPLIAGVLSMLGMASVTHEQEASTREAIGNHSGHQDEVIISKAVWTVHLPSVSLCHQHGWRDSPIWWRIDLSVAHTGQIRAW